ncbi:MAG: energy transducer TonB [Bacteroidota bacterium]
MQRPDISRLRKNRPIFLKVGLAGALAILLLAFNWTTDFPNDHHLMAESGAEEDLFQVIRTAHKKPRPLPPPPVIESRPELPLDDPEFDPEPEPEPVPDLLATPADPKREPAPTPSPRITPPAPTPVLPVPEPTEVPEEIFRVVEEMPRFPGCEEEALPRAERQACAERKMLEFVYRHIRYPDLARQGSIEGTAVVRFVVEKDGSITNLEILRDPGGRCGQEALRVVELMPQWLPGKQRGRPVRVQYNLPIRYILQ